MAVFCFITISSNEGRAILDVRSGCQIQTLLKTIQGIFHTSLVSVVPVVLEKIKVYAQTQKCMLCRAISSASFSQMS